jgi:hypothetical protein
VFNGDDNKITAQKISTGRYADGVNKPAFLVVILQPSGIPNVEMTLAKIEHNTSLIGRYSAAEEGGSYEYAPDLWGECGIVRPPGKKYMALF